MEMTVYFKNGKRLIFDKIFCLEDHDDIKQFAFYREGHRFEIYGYDYDDVAEIKIKVEEGQR